VQIGILEPLHFSDEARGMLARLGTVCAWDGKHLNAFLAPLDVLFVRLAHRIDRDVLEQAPRLRWLCSPTTGHLHLDEDRLRANGVKVLSLRGEKEFLQTVRATPEHTFGLILAVLRRYGQVFADTAAGGWNRDKFRGSELFEKRVGIIGLGRVGFQVASYCSAFGASIVWCDPLDISTPTGWMRAPDIASVIEQSHIVVLCASVERPSPILGAAEIKQLKGRYFVNTARGELVDERSLLAAVRDNVPAGVAIDVVSDELGSHRLDEWRALVGERNLILTPHIAGATVESMARTECFLAAKLIEEVRRSEATA
jgi:D-3-phosphoglycerate dehydrogenase